MSFPYPQDRTRERREKGDQPYQDAKEAMSEKEAELQAKAEAFGEARRDEDDDERGARLASEAEERLAEVNRRISGDGDTSA